MARVHKMKFWKFYFNGDSMFWRTSMFCIWLSYGGVELLTNSRWWGAFASVTKSESGVESGKTAKFGGTSNLTTRWGQSAFNGDGNY